MTVVNPNVEDLIGDIDFANDSSLDQSVAKSGGDYSPPAKGVCRLRLVGYIELGQHQGEFQGKPKVANKVRLIFELSGPKHPAKKRDDGSEYLETMKIDLSLSQSNKSGFFKLFTAMRAGYPEVKHMSQLLDKDFRGEVFHTEKEKDGKKVVYAGLRREDGSFSVSSPFYEDAETGDTKRVTAAPRTSPLRVFLFQRPKMAMWDSLFIDGSYDDGKSKNIHQDAIRSAINFPGSPIAGLLGEDTTGSSVEGLPYIPKVDVGDLEDAADPTA